MLNYKFLDTDFIPKLPNYIIDECIDIIIYQKNKMPHRATDRLDDAEKIDFTNRLDVPLPIAVSQMPDQKKCFFKVYLPPESLINWCKEFLPQINLKRIWLTHVGGGDMLIPHVDLTSDVKINLYLTDVSGNSQWYKPKKEFEHLLKNGHYNKDGQHLLSRLDVIDDVILEKHKWYAFRSGIPHGVVNIKNDRMFIALGSDDLRLLADPRE